MNKFMPVILSKEQITKVLNNEIIEIRRPINVEDVPQDVEVIGAKVNIGNCYGKDLYQFIKVNGQRKLVGEPFTCPFIDNGEFDQKSMAVDHEYQLWVQEEWRIGAWNGEEGEFAIDYLASPEITNTPWVFEGNLDDFKVLYNECINDCIEKSVKKSDYGYVWEPGKSPCRIREAATMPYWASRLKLDIINIAIETNIQPTTTAEWVITVKQGS